LAQGLAFGHPLAHNGELLFLEFTYLLLLQLSVD
jgi:hypothetical protein